MPLCGTCEREGREVCALAEYQKKVSDAFLAAQDLAVTPSPFGGNKDLAEKLRADTDADFVDLAVQAKKRGCTVFVSPSSE